ncbi:NAD(P)H-dependent glycerol-3-phosphate dehydrogenase, partial [Fibrobacterota bacterium]
NGHEVLIWSHDQAITDGINSQHENKALLPGIKLPEKVTSTTSLDKACEGAGLIVLVVSSKFYASMVDRMKSLVRPPAFIVSATKGLNEADNKRVSEVLYKGLPESCRDKIAVLSGPNISREIALRKPSATVISSRSNHIAAGIQKLFNSRYFRVYTNTDVIGTELGGILKNIIAIAGGIIDGMELGDNAKSAVMVRGLVEISRFAVNFGAKPETFNGLAGMGDLITTCSSTLSRNHYVGEHLGKGMKLSEILPRMEAVAEGVRTTRLIYRMAKEAGIEMPVTEQVYQVLFEDKPVRKAIEDLMSRDIRPEA